MNEIFFSKLSPNDAEDARLLWSDEEATLFTNFPYLPTLDECRERVSKMLSFYGQNANHFGPYVIRATTGEFLGLTGGDADKENLGIYEIWYFVRRDMWGKRIATKAVEHLLTLMKESGRVHTIKAEAVVDNKPSWLFLEKLGFNRSKILPDAHTKNGRTWNRYLYSMTVK